MLFVQHSKSPIYRQRNGTSRTYTYILSFISRRDEVYLVDNAFVGFVLGEQEISHPLGVICKIK